MNGLEISKNAARRDACGPFAQNPGPEFGPTCETALTFWLHVNTPEFARPGAFIWSPCPAKFAVRTRLSNRLVLGRVLLGEVLHQLPADGRSRNPIIRDRLPVDLPFVLGFLGPCLPEVRVA